MNNIPASNTINIKHTLYINIFVLFNSAIYGIYMFSNRYYRSLRYMFIYQGMPLFTCWDLPILDLVPLFCGKIRSLSMPSQLNTMPIKVKSSMFSGSSASKILSISKGFKTKGLPFKNLTLSSNIFTLFKQIINFLVCYIDIFCCLYNSNLQTLIKTKALQ